MPEYSIAAFLACILVVFYEKRFARTGLFGDNRYWISMGIVLFFMVLVDGWLTKLSAPIVLYDDARTTGIRFPFDIPIEDYFFGFALVTLALVQWRRSSSEKPRSES